MPLASATTLSLSERGLRGVIRGTDSGAPWYAVEGRLDDVSGGALSNALNRWTRCASVWLYFGTSVQVFGQKRRE